jgi:purine-nucleoside phosphorylase
MIKLSGALRLASRRIANQTSLRPQLAIVLGSGFHCVAERLLVEAEIPFANLPGFPQPAVPGHAGKLLVGRLSGVPVLLLSGRAHYYEGHAMESVTFAVRVLREIGIEDLLLTNAAGGIHRAFRPGDFMRIEDHINLMGANPLLGVGDFGGTRFLDLSRAYDPQLARLLDRAAARVPLRLRRGIYLAVSGPSYETPAEIRAFARLGADAVGMSTVPEVIVARQCGLRVAGLSCITNCAAGLSQKPLSHQEVLAIGERLTGKATKLLEAFAELYGETTEA